MALYLAARSRYRSRVPWVSAVSAWMSGISPSMSVNSFSSSAATVSSNFWICSFGTSLGAAPATAAARKSPARISRPIP